MIQTELKALSLWRTFESLIRRSIISIFPNFDSFDQVVYAKIITLNLGGGKVDVLAKGLSADVQVLNPDFSDNLNFAVVKDVPFDSALFGTAGGAFNTPPAGARVRLGFMYNSPLFPFILSVTNEDATVPAATEAEYKIETDSGDTVRIKGGEITLRIKDGPAFQVKGGKVKFKTGNFNSDMDTVINQLMDHNHGYIDSITSPPAPVATPKNTDPGSSSSSDFTGGDL